MRQKPTVALILQSVCDVFMAYGVRWGFQIIATGTFFLGLGIGTAWWVLWLSHRMSCP